MSFNKLTAYIFLKTSEDYAFSLGEDKKRSTLVPKNDCCKKYLKPVALRLRATQCIFLSPYKNIYAEML